MSVAVIALVGAPAASAEESAAPTSATADLTVTDAPARPQSTPEVGEASSIPAVQPPVVDEDSPGQVELGSTIVGQLVQAWPEHATVDEAMQSDQGPLAFVEQTDGSSVRVPNEDVEDVPVGATVEVTVGDEMVDASAEVDGLLAAREVLEASVVAPAPASPAIAAAGTAVTNSVTIVRVVPAGGQADSMSVATLSNAVNGPVADFWRTQSRGRIQLGTTSGPTGWITSGASCSDPTGLWNSAAAAAGWTAGPNRHLLVYVSSLPQSLPGCSYGLAEVGTSATSGGRLYVRAAGTSLIAHELGHNFGLGHSSQLQCDGSVETGTCQVSPYRDFYDVMGASWSQLGSLNAAQASRLGVIPPSSALSMSAVDRGAFVELQPMGAEAGVRTLRLTSAAGEVYWLELRSAVGQDRWMGSASANVFGLNSGVLVHRPADADETSLLLDATPTGRSGWDSDGQSAVPFDAPVSLAGGDFVVSAHATPRGTVTIMVATRAQGPSALAADQALAAGQALVSPGGGFRATLQSDGNLVVYGSGDRVLWANYRWAPPLPGRSGGPARRRPLGRPWCRRVVGFGRRCSRTGTWWCTALVIGCCGPTTGGRRGVVW
ncbi:reprolysin-like metallopeptidase [Geodermatophilus sp. Leaf369]|uniref:reprolysin-like metallopeptidase n=1 Tax=Geodermatophilus sp. Leaf369 TaxID=1736354 RepID=UPI0012FBA3E8|nr:hypothetical protein [Geodermatophilus sp. Leaf369]